MEIDILSFLSNAIAGQQDPDAYNALMENPLLYATKILDDALSDTPQLDYSNTTNNNIIFKTFSRIINSAHAVETFLGGIMNIFLRYIFDFSIFSELFADPTCNGNNIFSDTSEQLFQSICEEGYHDVNLVIRYLLCSKYKKSSKLSDEETIKYLEIMNYYLTIYNTPDAILFFKYNISVLLSTTQEVIFGCMEQFSTIVEKIIYAIHNSELQYQVLFIKQLSMFGSYIDKSMAGSIIDSVFDSDYLTSILEQKVPALPLVITQLFEYFNRVFIRNPEIELQSVQVLFEFCVLATDYNNFDIDISASKDMFYFDMFGNGERNKIQDCFITLINNFGIEIDQDLLDSLKTCENGLYLLAGFTASTDNSDLRTAIIDDVREFLAENATEGDVMYQLASFYFNSRISCFVDDDSQQILEQYSNAIEGLDEQPELMSVVITILMSSMIGKKNKMVYGEVIEDFIDNQRYEILCDQLKFMILAAQFLSNPNCPDHWGAAVPTILSLFLSFIFGQFVMLSIDEEKSFNINDFVYILIVDAVFQRWYAVIDKNEYRNAVDIMVGYFSEDQNPSLAKYTDYDVYTAIYALSGSEYEPPEGSEPAPYAIEDETLYSFHELVEGLRWCPLQEGCENFMLLLIEMLDKFSECRIYLPHITKLRMLLQDTPDSFRRPIGPDAVEQASLLSIDFTPDESTIAIDVVAGVLIEAIRNASYPESIEPIISLINFVFCNFEVSEPVERLHAAAETIEEKDAIGYKSLNHLIARFEGQVGECEEDLEE